MTSPSSAAGRPRDEKVDRAIVAATRELLIEQSYASLTVAAVAARAGVGKAAIYRRYATKQEMIFAAAVHGMQELVIADQGSLEADCTAFAVAIAERLSGPKDVLRGLLADIYADRALGDRFSDTFLADERTVLAEILARAAARGDLAGSPDPLLAQALLVGPVFAWLLILDGEPDRAAQVAATIGHAAAAALRGVA